MSNKRGFTLLEVLIVIIIIGVLAGLAIPAYQAAVEKSRGQEALAGLGAARQSMIRFYAQNNTYTGATMPLAGGGNLDYNPNNTGTASDTSGQRRLFDYGLAAAGNTFTITATRTAGTPAGGAAVPTTPGPHTIVINELGLVTKNGAYA